MLSPHVVRALSARTSRDADAALADYDRDRIREFRGKWAVERMIGAAVSFPALMNIAARSLALRPAMANTIVGVTGDFVPAREVLRAGFLAKLVMPFSLDASPAPRTATSSKPS